MKLFSTLIFSIVAAIAVLPAYGNYFDQIDQDDPIAYYRLNESPIVTPGGSKVINDTNTIAIDQNVDGGDAFDGIYLRSWSGSAASVTGALLDGSGDAAIELDPNALFMRSPAKPAAFPFTYEVWIRHEVTFNGGTVMELVDNETNATYYTIDIGSSVAKVITRSTASDLDGIAGTTNIDDGQWHHIVVVFEALDGTGGKNGRATMYIDGNVDTPEFVFDFRANYLPDAVDSLVLGLNEKSSLSGKYQGGIDEVALYDYALSTDRIAAHYLAAQPPSPTAEAGEDQSYRADRQNNPVSVTLDASASYPDDSPIQTFSWTVDGQEIASGETVDVDFEVGEYLVVLTVTDLEGDFDTDILNVTIIDGLPVAPVADAGDDQVLVDEDEDGFETFTLDGSASYSPEDDGSIVSVQWTDEDDQVLSTSMSVELTEDKGRYIYTLTVTDNFGNSSSDNVVIMVGGEQLLNLPGDRPVFPVPEDIVWPENVGDPHICLWYGDKFAAMSITIDDNCAPQHDWWMQLGAQYNFTPTWFIVVGGVQSGSNPSFNGTWQDWIDLDAVGGSVQSHSMSHHSDDDERTDEEVHYEYGQSQYLIDTNVTEDRCLALAYPYGAGKVEIAREYFIACRGVNGTPNKPGRINWMNTNSTSGRIDRTYTDAILYGTSDLSWLNSTTWKRSWLCTHFHYIQDTAAVEAEFAYIDTVSDLIWMGSFVDVAKFGQERDSAEITMLENTAAKISFELADRMDDTIFDHPLSIKFRIPDEWNAQAAAVQNGQPVNCEIIENGDYDYVLVDAVPDKGVVEITSGAVTLPGDIDGNGEVNIFDFLILKSNYGTTSGATSADGDCDADGDVDIFDFLILKANYGSSI